jgi:uncharacterized protein (DUF362 family)/Pyruvate/2-oxoacid:ferredoxin oxidoreductase delta subunit
MKSSVSIVRCASYEAALLERALNEAAEKAGGLEVRGASVLVKPNLLNANGYERAVTTHPALVAATVRWLKRGGAARVLVGDSPGWQAQDFVGKKSGIREAAEESGAEWADFSQGREVDNPEGRLVKSFSLAAPLSEVDLLVSLPKLKTHELMYYSGAIKNLFGLVPGLEKSAFHLRFPRREDFAAMLADLALAAAPDFSIMDAVVAMEGPGPNNGRPKSLGLLLASKDPLAMDWAAAGLIGYEPEKVPYLAELMARAPGGLRGDEGETRARWISSAEDISIAGLSLAEARPASFELIPLVKETDFFRKRLPPWLHRFVKDFLVPRPVFDHGKCVRCGGCVNICPAKALSLKAHGGPGGDNRGGASHGGSSRPRIEIDYRACLRCYCCHEVCPENAIRLVKRIL